MRLFRRRPAGKGGAVPDRAGAERGATWTGFGDSGTDSPFDFTPSSSAPAHSAREVAESRTSAGRRPEGRASSPGYTPESTGSIMAKNDKAAGKKYQDGLGKGTGYNPYAASDTGHI